MDEPQAELGRSVMTDAYERVGAAYQAARHGVYDRHPDGYHGGWNARESVLILELEEAEIDVHRLRGTGKHATPTLPESAG
jgi:hypothetical protein